MFRKIWDVLDSFRGFFLKSYNCVASVAVLAVSGFSGLLFAADPEPVTVTVPEFDWGTVAADLVSALTTIAVVGLGIALSVWVLFLVSKVFKRSAT
jgi:hypothetical protein